MFVLFCCFYLSNPHTKGGQETFKVRGENYIPSMQWQQGVQCHHPYGTRAPRGELVDGVACGKVCEDIHRLLNLLGTEVVAETPQLKDCRLARKPSPSASLKKKKKAQLHRDR